MNIATCLYLYQPSIHLFGYIYLSFLISDESPFGRVGRRSTSMGQRTILNSKTFLEVSLQKKNQSVIRDLKNVRLDIAECTVIVRKAIFL